MEIDEYTMKSLGFLCLGAFLVLAGWATYDVRVKLAGWVIFGVSIGALGGHVVWLAWFMDPLILWSAIVFYAVILLAVFIRILRLCREARVSVLRQRGLSARLSSSSELVALGPRR